MMNMANGYTRRPRRRNQLDRLTLILIGVFSVLSIATAIVAFIWVRDVVASWSSTQIEGAPVDSGSTNKPTAAAGTTTKATAPSGALQTVRDPTAAPWDGASRVTLLLMGLDYRDWQSKEIPRTDSMILLTLDPLTKTAGMLTVPRDMWVNIPGFDHGKINTAYFLGESYKVPGGGPGLAMTTMEQFIGVPIQYYAVVDFYSFAKFIDEINGIKLDFPEDMDLDPLGPGPKIHIKKGRYAVGGEVALAYARNRYTDGGDFDRSQRQLQVIMAIRDRILSFNMLPILITKAPTLYKELSSGVRTNLTMDQIIRLATLGVQVPDKNIRRAVINQEDVTFGTSPDGLSILKPVPDKIRMKRDEVFATGGPMAPVVVSGDPVALMKAEKARVVIQNGTGTVGLAERTKDYLVKLGVNVVDNSNASQRTTATTIYDYTGKPNTVSYLVKQLNIRSDRIFNRLDPNSKIDVLVVLGDDWVSKIPQK